MASSSVVLKYVVPAFGVLTAAAMYVVPLQAVVNARRTGVLGALNPIPFAATFANTAAWMAYSFLIVDYFVFAPNVVGVPAGLFNTMICYSLAPRKTQDVLLTILVVTCVALSALGMAAAALLRAGNQQPPLTIFGVTTNVVSISFYAAPLSTAWQVVRSRDSSSIFLPAALTNLVNGALWTAYGIAVTDVFIWIPNGTGVVMSLGMLALRLLYPARPAGAAAAVAASLKSSSSDDGLLPVDAVVCGIQLASEGGDKSVSGGKGAAGGGAGIPSDEGREAAALARQSSIRRLSRKDSAPARA